MTLKEGALLQGGKYKIVRVLGQGGFGITYLGEQTSLGRKVAIKEFFMKELCNRDEATSHVSVGSEGSREMVTKFREKFVKEARNIASLEHPHIVSVIDVFKENGTAYYVMKYCDGGSLAQLIKEKYPSGMLETMALKYIREVASALDYIHKRSINHLDVKPANIMLNESDSAVLIDFGLSKQYDAETGQQTSSTPVGISEGYAPMEQYKKGGVGQFSPSTDIYSLGATLYKLITGQTPLSALDLGEEPLPVFNASSHVKNAICSAMEHRRADRPQSVAAFLSLLDGDSEDTHVDLIPEHQPKPAPTPTPKPQPRPVPTPTPLPTPTKLKSVIYSIIAATMMVLAAVLLWGNGGEEDPDPTEDVVEVVEITEDSTTETAVVFTCNVPTAKLFVDGKEQGCASGQHFLKAGSHTIKATAEGYKDYTSEITVSNEKLAYSITMTEKQKTEIAEAPASQPTTGKHQGHDWVDLGLPSGTKWATMNVGATSLSDYGNYYAWGETRPKSNYDWKNLKYWISGIALLDLKFSKYVTDSQFGKVDNKTELELNDDAAYANWGAGWRMPSREQLDELCKKCEWKKSTLIHMGHSSEGYTVEGPNGNDIFLPYTGFGNLDSSVSVGVCGIYRSRTLEGKRNTDAYGIYIDSSIISRDSHGVSRYEGCCVRAVRDSE